MENEKNLDGGLNKWRLILGEFASGQISYSGNEVQYMGMEQMLDFLYSREYGEGEGVRERRGGQEASQVTVAEWITKIRKLFPKQTVEILEKHALEKYEMTELLTDKEVLEKLEPNRELLKTILSMKHLMKGEVLETAKKIVRQIADELTRKMEQSLKRSLLGRIDKNSNSNVKSARNFDFKRTIRKNLKNYDREKKRMVLERVYFNDRLKKFNQWRVIIAVDESGSMLDSVIHSAIMAGIFSKLPMLDTRLVIFDTQVVDLSGYISDPVETLMSVQLGGGTNITGALTYCEGLIENPHRTMVVLVTDLFEGFGYQNMYAVSRGIIESGAKLIVLTALDLNADPNYDKNAGAHLASMGAHVAAMTPEGLADWIGKIIQ